MKHTTGTLLLCKTFCMLAFVAATSAAQAQTNVHTSAHFSKGLYQPLSGTFRADIVQLTPNVPKFNLRFNNPAREKVVVTITDASTNLLYNQAFTDAAYVQTYDLSMLPDGAYTFTLTKGKEMIRKTVLLNTDYVVVKKVSIR